MGAHIIHFDDKPWQDLDDEQYYRCKEIPWFSTTKTTISRLTPYTEPDIEQVRKEAYEKGYETAKHEYEDCTKPVDNGKAYQQGLSDAWEAARKICLDDDDGGIPASVINDIFNVRYYRYALKDFSATEAIEKIRQYEQEKEEQIIKGDIVLIKSTPEVEILATYANEEYVSGIALTEVDGNCEIGDQYTNIRISNVEKTGKHYDIVSVLQKMREESNG